MLLHWNNHCLLWIFKIRLQLIMIQVSMRLRLGEYTFVFLITRVMRLFIYLSPTTKGPYARMIVRLFVASVNFNDRILELLYLIILYWWNEICAGHICSNNLLDWWAWYAYWEACPWLGVKPLVPLSWTNAYFNLSFWKTTRVVVWSFVLNHFV